MRSSGFTTTELLIAIAIMSVVAVFAFPAANNFLEGGRLTSTANGFVEAFMTARSEAVKRGQPVRVMPGEGAVGFRVATASDPETDIDADDPSTYTEIAVFPAVPDSLEVKFYQGGEAADVEFVEYMATGIRSGGAQDINIYICNQKGTRGRRVDLIASGGTQVEQLDTECPDK